MTVFGVGTLELILVLLLLILIFGPDRINEMGRWLGQSYRKLTGLSSEVNQQVMEVRRAMDATIEDSGLSGSIREAAAEVNSLQREVNKSVSEGTAAVKDLQTDVKKTIAESQTQAGIKQPEVFEESDTVPDEITLEAETEDQHEGIEQPEVFEESGAGPEETGLEVETEDQHEGIEQPKVFEESGASPEETGLEVETEDQGERQE